MSFFGSVVSGLQSAVSTVSPAARGFNQGLVNTVGTGYDALVNGPKEIYGAVATALGRVDLAPNVTPGADVIGSMLNDHGLGFMTAAPAAGDLPGQLLYNTASFAPGFLVPEVELPAVGDALANSLVKASSVATCRTCIAQQFGRSADSVLKAVDDLDVAPLAHYDMTGEAEDALFGGLVGQIGVKKGIDAVSHGLDVLGARVSDAMSTKKEGGGGGDGGD
jgi:hypothetical protein